MVWLYKSEYSKKKPTELYTLNRYVVWYMYSKAFRKKEAGRKQREGCREMLSQRATQRVLVQDTYIYLRDRHYHTLSWLSIWGMTYLIPEDSFLLREVDTFFPRLPCCQEANSRARLLRTQLLDSAVDYRRKRQCKNLCRREWHHVTPTSRAARMRFQWWRSVVQTEC